MKHVEGALVCLWCRCDADLREVRIHRVFGRSSRRTFYACKDKAACNARMQVQSVKAAKTWRHEAH